MRLITEHQADFSTFQILTIEGVTGPEALRFRGPFLKADIRNKNKRLYPYADLRKAADKYNEERILTHRAMGELGHPEGCQINLHRVSHVIESIEWEGTVAYGTAKLLDTPLGKIAETLIRNKLRLGVSSRGLGDIQKVSEGCNVGNYYLITVDLVGDPSTPDAFVDGIFEAQEYVIESSGNIIARTTAESAYDQLHYNLMKLPRRDRQTVVQNAIDAFIKSL